MDKNNISEAYKIYSDESSSENKRYQSICCISGYCGALTELTNSLRNVITIKNVAELKFSKIRTHKSKIEAGEKFIELAVKYAASGKIRIDVLTYDLQDSRHTVSGRDDIKNLEIMYYKLLRHCCEKWNKYDWEFYPDENSAYNWVAIKDYLNSTKLPRKEAGLLKLFLDERINLNFTKVEQKKSHAEPLIQLADLFAGFSWFSILSGEECLSFIEKEINKYQGFLFEESENKTENYAKVKVNRFLLIKRLYDLCKENKLGVSLKTNKRLYTPNPNNPINFWKYEPQGEYDKAPTRKTKK